MTASLYFGQQGTGKSTVATGEALEYLRAGRRVVCNYPIDPSPAVLHPSDPMVNAVVEVIPSRPVLSDLKQLGLGWLNPEDIGREEKCGLIVIDEAGPWLSARDWNGEDRKALIDFLVQTRKRGWDLIFLAHTPIMIDKQVRDGVIEIYGRCKRTDRMKKLGFNLPRMHICVCRYGASEMAPMVERRMYRGAIEHKCFQSYAVFGAEEGNDAGWYSVLPPRLTEYRNVKKGRFTMKGVVIAFSILFGGVGFLGGWLVSGSDPVAPVAVASAAPVDPVESEYFRMISPAEIKAKNEKLFSDAADEKENPYSDFVAPDPEHEIVIAGCYATPKHCRCTYSDGSIVEDLDQVACMDRLGVDHLPEPSGSLGLSDLALSSSPNLHRRSTPSGSHAFESRLIDGQWVTNELR